MHGVRNLDEVYAFYRQPEIESHCGPEMVQFLDCSCPALARTRSSWTILRSVCTRKNMSYDQKLWIAE
jgi:hypothetical protein